MLNPAYKDDSTGKTQMYESLKNVDMTMNDKLRTRHPLPAQADRNIQKIPYLILADLGRTDWNSVRQI